MILSEPSSGIDVLEDIKNDELRSLQQTQDGGFILGGVPNSDSSGDKTEPSWGLNDYWIIRIDEAGNKLWDKRYGGADEEKLYSLKQTSDGGFIPAGYTLSGISGDKTQPSRGGYDYWIIKTDSLGIKLWDKRFGGTLHDQLSNMKLSMNGDIIVGGSSYSDISGNKSQSNWNQTFNTNDYWVIKMDLFGNKQWDKRFCGFDFDRLMYIEEVPN